LGRDGQLGRSLAANASLSSLGQLVLWGRAEADLTKPQELASKLKILNPSAVINAAAFTAVDAAETREREASLVNAESPAALAAWAADSGARLIHFSTDYVHDGRKSSPYVEEDSPNPISVYGRTKLEGDEAVLASGSSALIFRVSWLFSPYGRNFPKTILKLASERRVLTVNADQIGAPASAELAAESAALGIGSFADRVGLYHLASSGATTRIGLAKEILARAREMGFKLSAGPEDLVPSYGPSPDWPAPRPLNSRLDTTKFQKDFDLVPPVWTVEVERFLLALRAGNSKIFSIDGA
jgi:dTDP-4-dehydrorhamnose reductase